MYYNVFHCKSFNHPEKPQTPTLENFSTLLK